MGAGEFSDVVRARVMARAGGSCEARVKGRCCGRGAEFHHRRPRGMGGTRRPETGYASTALLLCVGCHAWIESHRSRALELGWLVPQHADPALCPVWRESVLGGGGWVLLGEAGGLEPWNGPGVTS